MKRLVKNQIQCVHCGDIITSRYRNEYVTCSCGRCAVDGGLDYARRYGDLKDWEDLSVWEECRDD